MKELESYGHTKKKNKVLSQYSLICPFFAKSFGMGIDNYEFRRAFRDIEILSAIRLSKGNNCVQLVS